MSRSAFEGVVPHIGARVFIHDRAVVIGQASLADDVSIWPTAVVRGDVAPITIGARTNIQDGSVLHANGPTVRRPAGQPLRIGADVTVGHRVILHACTVADRCLIGMGAIVLDEAIVDEEVFVAAGALVTPGKTLAPRGLYAGSPARRVRDLTAAEIDGIRESAARYVRLKAGYLESINQS